MARDKTKPRNGPWQKRVLIPFWVIQLGLMLFVFILYIFTIVEAAYGFQPSEVLLVILSGVCIALDITEIILFARRNLKPLNYLIFQLVKTPIWFGLFVDDLVRGLIKQDGDMEEVRSDSVDTLGIIIFAVLFFIFLGTLIYGSVIYHRHRRNKRKGLMGNNITQNPYYNGPYSENGITTANYQPLNSPYPFHSDAGSTAYGDEGAMTAVPAPDHYTPDLQDKKRRLPSYGDGPMELFGQERNTLMSDTANELPSVPEVYELASAKSVKGSRHRSSELGA